VDPRLLPAYLKASLRHSWWLLLVVVGAVGDVATVVGDYSVPRWLWYSLIAVGILAAQFGAYCDVKAELATVRARLRELNTAEEKRAYLDDCVQEARTLIEDVAAQGADWYGQNTRINADLDHWETGVRAEIRKAWGHQQARRFDTHTATGEPDQFSHHDPADAVQEYIERRITRLAELRDETH
jgi:hypothetical protein